jgi:hypothetical protein
VRISNTIPSPYLNPQAEISTFPTSYNCINGIIRLVQEVPYAIRQTT